MNSLSWLIYLSQVVPSAGVLFTLAGIGSACAVGALVLFGAINRDVYADSQQYEWGKQSYDKGVAAHRTALRLLPLPIVVGFLAIATPSKETILLIAASEMGETVVKTPEAQEIFSDLKTILKKQLEGLNP